MKTNNKEKQRMSRVLDVLSKLYPDVKIQLDFNSPYELLVATILSAQCTDDRVNQVTKVLFKKLNTPQEFSEIAQEKLEKLIFSTGFYKAKTKNIIATSKLISEKFDGKVPENMEDLLSLPGVGRKTANVVLGHCFDTHGIVVDTHVLRISNKLRFIDSEDAVKVEFKLMELIPKEQWVIFTHYFINHGRKVCTARSPKCSDCQILSECPTGKDQLKASTGK